MPEFAYRAKKGPKEIVNGSVEAASLDEAMEKLDRLGLLPIQLEEAGSRKPEAGSKKTEVLQQTAERKEQRTVAKKPIFGGVKSSEVTIFGRQLASLVKSGVPILRALWIIGEQTANPRLKDFLVRAQEEIRNGQSLSSVFSQYPKFFPPLYIAMVKTGEDSGALESTLLRISDYRQKQEEIWSRVRTAMAYPILMAVTGIGTIIFMLTFVIPKLTSLFKSMGSQLPLPTRILMEASAFFRSPWVWVFLGSAAVTGITLWKTRAEAMKALWGRVSLKIPLIKSFVMKSETARFSRTLELLLRSGISILRAIEVTTPVLENGVLRGQLEKTRADLTGGASLGASLRESNLFPLFVTNLISVGEESGKLDEAMQEIAQFYERETDEMIKIMTTLLEPLMMLGMGLVVGFIVIAMLLPMFELNLAVK